MKDLLELKGRLVVSRDEGVRLGLATGLTVDDAVGRIAALVFRKKRRSRDRWVKTSDVVSVGPDLVVIASEAKVHDDEIPGRRLADYRGCWVTTLSGDHLGRLDDMATEGGDWSVNQLEFQDGSTVEVDGAQLVFGRDEILAPDKFASRIVMGARAVGPMARTRVVLRNFFMSNKRRTRRGNGRAETVAEETESEAQMPIASSPMRPAFGPEPAPESHRHRDEKKNFRPR